MMLWSIIALLLVGLAAFGSPWLLVLFLPAAAVPWWVQAKPRPLFIGMLIAVLAVPIRAHAELLELWSVYRQNAAGVPAGTRLYNVSVAQKAVAELILPIGVGLLIAVAFALVTEFMARHAPRDPHHDYARDGGIPPMSKWGHVQWVVSAVVAIAIVAISPLKGVPSSSDRLWLDIDDAIRHPGAFPDADFVATAFPVLTMTPPPRLKRLAAPCVALSYRLMESDRPKDGIDVSALTKQCATAAIDERDGFEGNGSAILYFATYACSDKGDAILGGLESTQAERFKKQFCRESGVEIVEVAPLRTEPADAAAEDFIVAGSDQAKSGEQSFVARVDGKTLRTVWRSRAEAGGKLFVADGHVLHVLGDRIHGFALDTGVQDDKVFGINGTIEEMAFNPRRAWEAVVTLQDKSHTLVNLRTGDVKREVHATSWWRPPPYDINAGEPCSDGPVTPSGARCQLANPRSPQKMPEGYEAVVTMSDEVVALILGAPSADPSSKLMVVGRPRKQGVPGWQRELDTRETRVSFELAPGLFVAWARKLTGLDSRSGDVLWEVEAPRDKRSRGSVLVISRTRIYLRESGTGAPLQVRDVNTGNLVGEVQGT